MADVTVKQLAQSVGIPVERLLNQLQEAGLLITDELHPVNEEQKRKLLNHLKGNQQSTERSPERITLRRKSVSQVTLGHDAHIEVRKKRTYVKRSVIEQTPEPEIEPEISEPTVDIDQIIAHEELPITETLTPEEPIVSADELLAPAVPEVIESVLATSDITPVVEVETSKTHERPEKKKKQHQQNVSEVESQGRPDKKNQKKKKYLFLLISK